MRKGGGDGMQLMHENIGAKDSGGKGGPARQWLRKNKYTLLSLGGLTAFSFVVSFGSGIIDTNPVQSKINAWNRILNPDRCAEKYPEILDEIQDECIRLMKEGRKGEARKLVIFEDSVQQSMNYKRNLAGCKKKDTP